MGTQKVSIRCLRKNTTIARIITVACRRRRRRRELALSRRNKDNVLTRLKVVVSALAVTEIYHNISLSAFLPVENSDVARYETGDEGDDKEYADDRTNDDNDDDDDNNDDENNASSFSAVAVATITIAAVAIGTVAIAVSAIDVATPTVTVVARMFGAIAAAVNALTAAAAVDVSRRASDVPPPPDRHPRVIIIGSGSVV